jgi:hypothetical protein
MDKELAPMDIVQAFLEKNPDKSYTVRELQEILIKHDLNYKRIRKACSGLINRKIIVQIFDEKSAINSPLKVKINK